MPAAQPESTRRRGFRRGVGLLIVLVVLGGAGVISLYWLSNRPQVERRPPETEASLVEVRPVRVQTETVVVEAMGTVVPARSIQLAARVSGQVVEVSPEFVPGGRFSAGDLMTQLDTSDLALAVRQQETEVAKRQAELDQRMAEALERQSDVTRAESDLALERGRQSVAVGEYKLLGATIDPEDETLVLRQPQLKAAEATCMAARASEKAAQAASEAAKASLTAAEVALQQAELDLARTTIRAPFRSTVESRNVDLGSQVNVGTSLASLVGTNTYWIRVCVPLDDLRWVDIPRVSGESGSTVRVYHEAAWGPEAYRVGTVDRLMPGLEPEGRMARLLVAVEDPLALEAGAEGRHPLMLGAYVRVEIVGREVPDCAKIPRSYVRDGNRLWLMRPDYTLEIRDLDIVWSGREHVYVTEGLSQGELLITSDLAAPVRGMALRTNGTSAGQPRAPSSRPAAAADGEGRS